MAGKVLAASGRQYPEAWSRRLSLPFAPALAYGDKRDAFDESVAEFCAGLKWKAKIAAESGDWREAVDWACQWTFGQVDLDFWRGIVPVNVALGGAGAVDDATRSYFLFLALKLLAEQRPGGREAIAGAIPTGWQTHPGVMMALGFWAAKTGDEENFLYYRGQVGISYLSKFLERLDIMRLEYDFTQNSSVVLPPWYRDLHGRYCAKPFTDMHLHNEPPQATMNFCCPLYSPFHINGGESASEGAAWASSASAAEFRRSIIEGDYTYCTRQLCPSLLSDMKFEVCDEGVIRNFKDKGLAPPAPVRINFNMDRSCNLACPSCRRVHYHANSAEVEKLIAFYEGEVKPLLNHPVLLSIDGIGEALASKVGLHVLEDLRAAGNSQVKLILATNGQLLTKELWEKKLAALNVWGVGISIDAATAYTYEQVRRPGKWPVLCRNMEHLADRAKAGTLRIQTRFVIQELNWREMPEFARLCKGWNVAEIVMQKYINMVGLDRAEAGKRDVFSSQNPCFSEASRLFNETRLYCENNGIIFTASWSAE